MANVVIGMVTLGAGLGLGITSVNLFRSASSFFAKATKCPATIVEVIPVSGEDGKTYSPVYEYQYQGKAHRHKSQVSTGNRPVVGQHAILFVDPKRPDRPKSKTEVMFWPWFVACFAAGFIIAGVCLLAFG
ncbi:MAG: DUF3592 domain-containing protein [Chthonomonas sp.]|nr:DUF3592 domain-containing protein [Chthonomonas sp.]